MQTSRLAARAARLNTAVHVAPKADQISLGGGYAFPDMLPDISLVAAEAAANCAPASCNMARCSACRNCGMRWSISLPKTGSRSRGTTS